MLSLYSLIKTNSSILILIASFFTTVVAIASIIFSYRNIQKSQFDLHFYEALKRFGEKDSPLVRSSAAIMLAQAGSALKASFGSFDRRLPFFKTSLEQLSYGLLLEENVKVSSSISDAVKRLVPYAPQYVLQRLYLANLQLQDELVSNLTDFFVSVGAESFEDFEKYGWYYASSASLYDSKVLKDLVAYSPVDFSIIMQRVSHRVKLMNDEEKRQYQMKTLEALEDVSRRLRLNVELCGYTLKHLPELPLWKGLLPKNRNARSFEGIFLVEVDLKDAKLRRVNLSYARLQYANLSNVRLQKAKLVGANLESANLKKAMLHRADLTGARLQNALLSGTKLNETNLLDAHIEKETLSEAVS
jgi:hypothetical protein